MVALASPISCAQKPEKNEMWVELVTKALWALGKISLSVSAIGGITLWLSFHLYIARVYIYAARGLFAKSKPR